MDLGLEFLFTAVYAANCPEHRRSLWRDLINLSVDLNTPWLIAGDFNCIRQYADKRGGAPPALSVMDEFNACIHHAGLMEMNLVDGNFTWSNSCLGQRRTQCKLDRVFCNLEFRNLNSEMVCQALTPGLSDHSPILMKWSIEDNRRKSLFRFFNYWCKEEGFLEVVQQAWNTDVVGSPMFRVVTKLKRVKKAITNWRKNKPPLEAQLLQARSQLIEVQRNLMADSTNADLANDEKRCKALVEHLANLEESMLRQKSRCIWLNLGDSNSKFFHASMKVRQHRNRISCTGDSDGNEWHTPMDIANCFVQHFTSILAPNQPKTEVSLRHLNLQRKLNDSQAQSLCRAFTPKDVEEVVFSSNSDKAPGPDGFNANFFKTCWPIIGSEEDPKLVRIGSSLCPTEKGSLIEFVQAYRDVFAWSYEDIPGLDRDLLVHRLPLIPGMKAVKEKLRRLRPEWADQRGGRKRI